MKTRSFWLGHSAVRVESGGFVLYVDPFDLRAKKCPAADVILLSNPKEGHTSPEDVEAIATEETLIVGPEDAVDRIDRPSRVVAPGDSFEIEGFRIRAVPAGTTRTSFFDRKHGWVGWVIGTRGPVFYYTGMTDVLPEMEEIRADVLFAPIVGRYTMDAAEATALAERIGATVKVPLLVMGDRYERRPGFTTSPAGF